MKNETKEQSESASTEEPVARGRRRLIKALGISGGAAFLGTKWSKPIIDKVVVPLHAQATPPPPS